MRQAARAAVRAGDARVPRADLAAAVAVNAPAHVDSLAPTVRTLRCAMYGVPAVDGLAYARSSLLV